MLTAEFFEKYWQRRVLFCSSNGANCGLIDSQLFSPGLISLRDIEYLIGSLAQVDRNWIQLVKQGMPLRPGAYATTEGFAGLPQVYAAYEAGHTIQLAKLHKRWPAVGRLCRAVEAAFLQAGIPLAMRIGSHLYLTPPGSTGLDPHYDNHDVLVLQVEGAKRWKVYGAMQDSPVEMQVRSVPRAELPPLEHDLLLESGDMLYVPRGLFHEASTAERHSVHITLDITPYTWADLLMRVVRCHPSLRESLPVGSLGEGGAILDAGREERADALAKMAGKLPSIAAAMIEHFLADLDPLPGSGLEQVDCISAVGLDTRLQRRAGTPSIVLEEASAASLLFPGASVQGPRVLGDWLSGLAELQPFAVRELPDDLAPADKVLAASELLRRGFLEFTSGEA